MIIKIKTNSFPHLVYNLDTQCTNLCVGGVPLAHPDGADLGWLVIRRACRRLVVQGQGLQELGQLAPPPSGRLACCSVHHSDWFFRSFQSFRSLGSYIYRLLTNKFRFQNHMPPQFLRPYCPVISPSLHLCSFSAESTRKKTW